MIRRTQEDGVSLILVLVALVVFGLLVPVLGQFGSVNGVSGYVLKQQRFDRYVAEDGMQGAIAWLQAHRPGGRAFAECPEITSKPLDGSGVKADYNKTVTVRCQGLLDKKDKDGNPTGSPQQTDTTPAYALQTLGGDIDVSGGGSISTAGAWWANGDIDVHSGTTVDASQDYVGATGSCSNITGTPTRCPATGTTVDDPGDAGKAWGFALPIFPDQVDPPRGTDCSSIPANKVVTFEPGLHWELPWLEELGSGGCGPVVLWFRPGTHNFDFTFYGDAQATWAPDGNRSAVVVVGGTPKGWNPTGGSSQVAAARAAMAAGNSAPGNDGGACDTHAPGAVLALAKDSTIDLRGTSTEVCGTGNSQHLSVTQVTQGAADAPLVDDAPDTTPTGVRVDSTSGTFGFPPVPPGAATLAGQECTGSGSCPGALSGTLRGDRAIGRLIMTVPTPFPENARMQSLRLSIRHREDPQDGDVTQLSVQLTGLPGAPSCTLARSPQPVPVSTSWRTDTFICDLTDVHLPALPSALTITYQAQLSRQGRFDPTPQADIALDRVWLHARSAHVDSRNSTASGDAFTVGGAAAVRLDGTVYLPTAGVRVDLGGRTDTSTRLGVVATSITIRNLPNDALWAPFSLPDGGTYTDRLVTLTATLDGKSEPDLTARVQFCDQHLDGGGRAAGCTGADPSAPLVRRWQPRF